MNCVEKSIKEKWEPILRGEHANQSDSDCACCIEYLHASITQCEFCPIKLYTGKSYCRNTPYYVFDELYDAFLDSSFLNEGFDLHAEVTAAAQWEIDLLHEVNASLKAKEAK